MKIGAILGFLTLFIIEYANGQQREVGRGAVGRQRNQRRTPKLIGFLVPQSDGTTKFQLLSDIQHNIRADQGIRTDRSRRRENGQLGNIISPDRHTVFGTGRQSQLPKSNRNVGRSGSFRNSPPSNVLHPSLRTRGLDNFNRESFITHNNNRKPDVATSSLIPDVSNASRGRPKPAFTKHIPQLHNLAESHVLEKPKIQNKIISKTQISINTKSSTKDIGARAQSIVFTTGDTIQDVAVNDNNPVDKSIIIKKSSADGVIPDSGNILAGSTPVSSEIVLRSTIQKEESLMPSLPNNGNDNTTEFSFSRGSASSTELATTIVVPQLNEVHSGKVNVSILTAEPITDVPKEMRGSLVDIHVASNVNANGGVIAQPGKTTDTSQRIATAKTEHPPTVLESTSLDAASNNTGDQQGVLNLSPGNMSENNVTSQRNETHIRNFPVRKLQQQNIHDRTTAINAGIIQANAKNSVLFSEKEAAVSRTHSQDTASGDVRKGGDINKTDASIQKSKQISSKGRNDIIHLKNEKYIMPDIVSPPLPAQPTRLPQYQQSEYLPENTTQKAKSGETSEILLPSDIDLNRRTVANVVDQVTSAIGQSSVIQDSIQTNGVFTTTVMPIKNKQNSTESKMNVNAQTKVHNTKKHRAFNEGNAGEDTLSQGSFVAQSDQRNTLPQLALNHPTRPMVQQPIVQNLPFQLHSFNTADQLVDQRFAKQPILQRTDIQISPQQGSFFQTVNGQFLGVHPQMLFTQPTTGGESRVAGAQQLVIGPNGQVFALVPQFPQPIIPPSLIHSLQQLIRLNTVQAKKEPLNQIQAKSNEITMQAAVKSTSKSTVLVPSTSTGISLVTSPGIDLKVAIDPVLREMHSPTVFTERKIPATDVPLVGDQPLDVLTSTSPATPATHAPLLVDQQRDVFTATPTSDPIPATDIPLLGDQPLDVFTATPTSAPIPATDIPLLGDQPLDVVNATSTSAPTPGTDAPVLGDQPLDVVNATSTSAPTPATDAPLLGDQPLDVLKTTSTSAPTVPNTTFSEIAIGSLQTTADPTTKVNSNADGGMVSLAQIRTLLISLIQEMTGIAGHKQAKTGSPTPVPVEAPSTVTVNTVNVITETVNTVTAVTEMGITSNFTTSAVNVTEALNITSQTPTKVTVTAGTTLNPDIEPGEGPPTTTMDPEAAEAAAEV